MQESTLPYITVTTADGLHLTPRVSYRGTKTQAQVYAELAGVNTKWLTVKVFAVMGFLVGVSSIISSARLNAATNSLGLTNELYVIAATVIGGTSLTGGRFNLAGSIVGALIIQTLTTTILSAGVPVEYTLVVKAIVVLAVCLLQSEQFRKATFGRFARSGGRG